jgi:hypothetical protein
MFDLIKAIWSYLEPRDWIASAALVVAASGVLLSLSSRRLAGRAFRLSLEANRRSQPSLDLYLADGKMRPIVEPPQRVCLLKLRITNQSDSPNGIRELKLRVDCRKPEQHRTNFTVQHDSSAAIAADGDVLSVPQGIGPRVVIVGMAVFPIPEQLIAGTYVESHTVILTNSHGRQLEHEVLFLREVRDAR